MGAAMEGAKEAPGTAAAEIAVVVTPTAGTMEEVTGALLKAEAAREAAKRAGSREVAARAGAATEMEPPSWR